MVPEEWIESTTCRLLVLMVLITSSSLAVDAQGAAGVAAMVLVAPPGAFSRRNNRWCSPCPASRRMRTASASSPRCSSRCSTDSAASLVSGEVSAAAPWAGARGRKAMQV